ncbi:uncharacterized protein PRCAT00003079001 [Priceomyces carsonii]|uniref:uncharacterized protein n=1 Tax=Priceomyces carsonii TaxID=28549 RepID=UPI002EDB1506|nr:unnamed protein product [Priceomyces carsonii]
MSNSIYQTNGKPLSQQALYQQKLKQGIFGGPGAPSIGVNTNASDTAALLAASADLTVKPSYERTIALEAQTAALAARKEEIRIWTRDQVSPYADAAASSSLSNSKATTTLKPVSSSSTLNIEKINQVANANSTKSLNSRFNPELDYRSGLKRQKPAEFLTEKEEHLAEEGALASLKHGAGYSNQVSSQRRSQSFQASDIVNAKLLAAANSKANEALKSFEVSPDDFKAKAQVYAHALAVAQKNSEERIKNNKIGIINLGGGLTMTQSELDKMATLIVQPVLKDLSTKAEGQREYEKTFKQKFEELTERYNKSKEVEVQKKSQERADIELAKMSRTKANDDRKKDLDKEYLEFQDNRNNEVEQKTAELKDLELKYAEEKEELLTEKQAAQNRIEEEEAKLIDERKTELKELQSEKDEILRPTLDSLKEESAKLKELTDARDALQSEVTKGEDLNKEYEANLKELTENLESTKAEIEKYTADLEAADKEYEETSTQVDDLHQQSSDELQKANNSHKDLDDKIALLTKTKEENLAKKNTQKEEIKNQIDEKVKEEHKINDELPEHLRKNIDEKKLRDTGSLFSVEEPSVKEVPLVNKKETEVLKPQEDASNPKSTAAIKSATKSPAKTTPLASPDAKKSGHFKRFTKFLRSPTKEKSAVSPKKEVSKPSPVAAVKKDTKEAVAVTAEPSKAAATKPVPKDGSNSEVSNDFDDDISLAKSKNQGGVFKEEI